MTRPIDDDAPKVEITPEMIEAGVGVLVQRYDAIGDGIDRGAAIEIFEAMAAKKAVYVDRRS